MKKFNLLLVSLFILINSAMLSANESPDSTRDLDGTNIGNLPKSYINKPDSTRDLDGTNISYEYTSGRSYKIKFEEPGISYRYLTGSKP